MVLTEQQLSERKKKNLRLLWLMAAFALFVFFASIPFWIGMARIIGNQAVG